MSRYALDSGLWPGLAKLVEETGELQQVLGKIMACAVPENAQYRDGTRLRAHLVEELGDVRAALVYFCEANGLSKDAVQDRVDVKLDKFRRYGQGRGVKVYVLTSGDYDQEMPAGVYSSLSRAQDQLPVTVRWEPSPSKTTWWGHGHDEAVVVYELELDAPTEY